MARSKNTNSSDTSRSNDSTDAQLEIFREYVKVYNKARTKTYYVDPDSANLMYEDDKKKYPISIGLARIVAEVEKDDGDSKELYSSIEGITAKGKRLRRIELSNSDLSNPNRLLEKWGVSESVYVFPNQNQRFMFALQQSGVGCPKKYIYTHTGYTYKDGKPCDYLTGKGSLEYPNIEVELDRDLNNYMLSGISKTDAERREAIKASLSLLDAHDPTVTYILLPFIYLAAIKPIIESLIGDTGFFLFLQGDSESGKSTIAAIAMNHFGRFTKQTPPATFRSTPNALEYMSFVLKDCILWIDDYHPQESKIDATNQDRNYQWACRASGDHATRRRLDSNMKLKKSYYPRCLFLATGELPPNVGRSAHARAFTVLVPRTRKDLSSIQQAGREATLSRAMADYIHHNMILDYDSLLEKAKTIYEKCLKKSNSLFGECRLSDQAALLFLSAYLLYDYAVKCKAITSEEAKTMYDDTVRYITESARLKEEQLRNEEPVNQYMAAIKDLINSGAAYICDLDNTSEYNRTDLRPYDNAIGWKDGKGYYLNGKASFTAVSKYYSDQGLMFRSNPQVLYRQLRDKGFTIPDKNNNPTISKNIGGKTARVLWFSREVFDSPDIAAE